MTAFCKRLLFLWTLLLLLAPAHAAITCTSVTSPGVTINYVANTTVTVQSYFTTSCTRGSTSDPTSITYYVKADNGQNRATHASGATLSYDVYTSSTCATEWASGLSRISDTITWSSGSTGTISKQTSYWACIVLPQQPTSSGKYSDTVKMELDYGGGGTAQLVQGSFPVSIYAPALCTIGTAPGNLNLPYVAFGSQVSRSTSFTVTCTDGMTYKMGLDVAQAVLSGVRYALSLSATSATGTGAAQSHTITATAPGGQAGTCPSATCTETRTHTLTITY